MSRRIALIVGVSQYDKIRTGLDSLAAPVNDAQAVYEVLHQYGGFNTCTLLPLNNHIEARSSGVVEKQELRNKLHELFSPQTHEKLELAVFYFSGHGVREDGQGVCLSTSDERLAVNVSWLTNLAKKSAAKNVCVWLDCCNSGEVLEFSDFGQKGFCVVAASHAEGEALAIKSCSLLTNRLCDALTPDQDRPEIDVLDFISHLDAHSKNLPQQVLFRGDSAFTLTRLDAEVTVKSLYPPDHRPYKGLLPFKTEEDSKFFFGRDGMIQQLLDRLSASRFVPLLGASGSGKSSLVLAGLLPKLPESDWQVLVMRPTAQPLQNLRDTLVRGFPDAQVGALASGADLQREVLRLVTAGKRLLLVIDQFEEVFTECRDDTARAAFFACLLEALDSDNPLHLVLTLRADFLGHCTEQAYSGLGQRLQYHALLLVAPTAGELREAITRPLALVGMRCEQALEDELIDQTLHAKGSLPLLQYVLEKLWQSARQERSRELTLTMYQQLGGQHGGGLRGVLNEKADAFYQQLEPQQQRLMEWLMVELTQVGDGQDDTRRTVTLQELHNRQPQYTAALDALLELLTKEERLLTQDKDDKNQPTITVAHEALIRNWERLSGRDGKDGWLNDNREIKLWRLRLEDSITAWKNNISGSLLREKRLIEAQQILSRYSNSLLIGQDERAFIAASQVETNLRKRLLMGSLVAFIMVLLVGIVATTWQWRETEQAKLIIERQIQETERQRQIAIQQKGEADKQRLEVNRQAKAALAGRLSSQSILAVGSPSSSNGYIEQGLLLAIQAFSLDAKSSSSQTVLNNGLQAVRHMRKIFYGHTKEINSAAFSPNNRQIISGSEDGTLRLWDTLTGYSIGGAWSSEAVASVAFSPDGKYVISGGSGDRDSVLGRIGTLQLWDVTEEQPIGNVLGDNLGQMHDEYVGSVAFSPDGKYIASGSNDETLRFWNATTGQHIDTLQAYQGIRAVAFSPDSKHIVSGGFGKTLQLLDTKTRQTIGESWQGHTAPIRSVAFSPDGKYVVSGSDDTTLRLWDVTTGKPIGEPWLGHENSVMAVAFSPDSKYVVSGGWDKTVRLWNVTTGKLIGQPWRGHKGLIDTVAFSSDGKHIISAGTDRVLMAWDAIDEHILSKHLGDNEKPIITMTMSLDNKHLINMDSDRIFRLWDITTGNIICDFKHEKAGDIAAMAFSPDNKYIISGGYYDRKLKLWNAVTGNPVGEPLSGHEGDITVVVFSPDSKYVASGSWDGTVRLWDIATSQLIGEPLSGHKSLVTGIAFSFDGKKIASSGADNIIRLWNIVGNSIRQSNNLILQNGDIVRGVAFNPDGKYLVSESSLGEPKSRFKRIQLWDVATARVIGELRHETGDISSMAFSQDGKYLVTGGDIDKALHLWDVATAKTIGDPWHGLGNGITALAFSPDSKRVISGSNDGFLQLWNPVSGQPLGDAWHGHDGRINSVLFSSDGKDIISGGRDGSLQMWDADPESWAKKACSIVNRNFSLAEWQRFIGDALPYEKTCPDLPAPGEDGWVEPYVGG